MTDSGAARAGFWFALVFPSLFIVDKYFGWKSTIAYAIVVAAILAFVPRRAARLSTPSARWLCLLTLAAVAAAFILVYPVVNTHSPGAGSDDDDALEAATRAMLAGHFPYSARTYLGNEIHHLPGSFVLAAPFVVIGSSALQNLFWLAAFFICAARARGATDALSLAWVIVLLSPAVMYEVVTGTGYLSNAISVALGLWWLMRTTRRDAAALAWGVTLASRANFILLVPLAFASLARSAGWRAAVRSSSLTCAVIAALTLPFYLHDPAHFTPLEGAGRMLQFDRLAPHLGLALMVVMAVLAVALAFRHTDLAGTLRRCALVQAFPVVAGTVLQSILDGRVNLTYARYGAFFAWFVFAALGVAGRRPEPAAAHGEPLIIR